MISNYSNTQLNKRVFVIHGRNNEIRIAIFSFLRSIGIQPIEWSQAISATGKPVPFIGEILDTAFSIAQALLVVFTPDDVAFLREEYRKEDDPVYEIEPTGQARPNVIFEAGMALGRFPDRTVFVEIGNLRPFSDIGGRYVIKLNNSTVKRQELAIRLQDAGCDVDFSGTDWHTIGDFSIIEKPIYDANSIRFQEINQEMVLIMSYLSRVNEGASIHSIKYATPNYLEDGSKNFLSDQRIQYYLEKLSRIGYLQYLGDMKYILTEDGREYLYNKGKL